MARSLRLWIQLSWFSIRGGFFGYLAYVLLLWAVQEIEYGRVDEEHFLYALFNPLLLPYLFWPPNWSELSRYDGGREVFLIFSGAMLVIFGALISLWFGTRPRPNRNAVRSLGL
jgi:hypothetical protein